MPLESQSPSLQPALIELARRQGRFGLIRVFERQTDGARLYCIDGSVQTMVRADGVSVFGYVHATKLLLRDAGRVLIIGGGGGSLASMLARAGKSVTVIEIDPEAEALARAYFGLDARVRWFAEEPLAFLDGAAGGFDAVVVDACDAQGLVDGFADADVLLALLAKACPAGALVINLVHEDGAPPWGAVLAGQLAARDVGVTLYRSEEGWEGNELLHLRASGPTDVLTVTDLAARPAETRTYLMSLRAHTLRPGERWPDGFA